MKLIKTIKNKASQYIAEIFVVTGLALFIIATFAINIIAGMYLSGVVMIAIGLFFAKRR